MTNIIYSTVESAVIKLYRNLALNSESLGVQIATQDN